MLSNDPNATMVKVNPDSAQWLMKSFEGFTKTHPDMLHVYLGTEDKKMYLEPKVDLPSTFDPTSTSWYKDAISNDGKAISTNPYVDTDTKKYVVTFAKTVKDVKGNLVGVIGIDVDLQLISSMVENIKLGENGYSAVLDSTGTVTAHKDKALLGKNSKEEPWIKNIMDSKENKLTLNLNGKEYLIYKRLDTKTNLTTVGFVPIAEQTAKIIEGLTIPIIVIVLSFIFVIIVGLYFLVK